MRYLIDNMLFIESLEIGLATGAMPPTFLRPRIDADSRLSLEPSTVLPYGTMNLLLAEHTASWSLLTTLETEIARTAIDTRLADLQAGYPHIDGPSIVDFFVRL